MIEQALLIGLSAWRVSALLSYEGGPLGIFRRLREIAGMKHQVEGSEAPTSWASNPLADLLSCPWCLSPWMAAAMYGVWQLEPVVVLVIAASSIVVMVERWNRA